MTPDPFKPDEVLTVWCQTTGQEPPRCLSDTMRRQFARFAQLYRRHELILVIKWLQSEIHSNEERGARGGLSRLSLQIRKFFESDIGEHQNSGKDCTAFAFTVFDDRLNLATAWAKRFAPHLLPNAPAKPVRQAKPLTEAEQEEVFRKALEAMEGQ